jgi:hypothetical protein
MNLPWRRLFRTRPSRVRRKAPGFKPNLMALDRRNLPSVSFQGGPVIPHVDVHNVFYGQGWAGADKYGLQRAALNQFQSDITGSPYLAMLGEYGVGRGDFGGSNGVYGTSAPANNTTVTESTIQSMLSTEINAGRLPEETGRQVYFVYLPPTVKSAFDQANNFFAHHGSFQMQAVHHLNIFGLNYTYYTTDTVYYAVVQHPQTTGDISGFNDLQSLTAISSHELSEAITDPDIRQTNNGTDWANSHLGWIDNQQYLVPPIFGFSGIRNPNYRNEIGDMASGQYASFTANGTNYEVQKEYSVYFGGPIISNGSQGYLADVPGTNTAYFSTTWSYTDTVDGRSMTVLRAIGTDGRWYTNFQIAPGDYSGWFTFQS